MQEKNLLNEKNSKKEEIINYLPNDLILFFE